jgi:PPOX class probable F420-dependent enzyme
MPKPPIPRELADFLTRPNPAVIATVAPDGAPHTAATWYLWENGRVLVNMDEGRRRLQHLRHNPRVSITALGQDEWYRQVTLLGRVASIDPDPALQDIDRLSVHYTGNPYARREQRRVSAWIEVASWYAWNRGRLWTGD